MSLYMNIKHTLIVLIICYGTVSSTPAQTAEISEPILVNASNNEDSKAAFALLTQTIKEGEIVVLIARLARGESRRKLNHRRLQVVHSYLDVTRTAPIPEQNVVTAEGHPMRGHGRIEVYLRSKLIMVFTFGRNQNFAPEP